MAVFIFLRFAAVVYLLRPALFCFIILLAPQNKRNGEEKWGANKRRGQKIAKEKEKRHN